MPPLLPVLTFTPLHIIIVVSQPAASVIDIDLSHEQLLTRLFLPFSSNLYKDINIAMRCDL